MNPGGAELLLTGSGFLGVQTVTAGGLPLSEIDDKFRVLDDNSLLLLLPEAASLGPLAIEVTNALGTGTTRVNIVPNTAPVLDLVNSKPLALSSLDTAQVYVGSGVGDTVYLFASPSSVPSVLQGLVSLDLANNFAELVQLGVYTVDASIGYLNFTSPLGSLPSGTEFFVQAATISASAPALPAPVTNLEAGLAL